MRLKCVSVCLVLWGGATALAEPPLLTGPNVTDDPNAVGERRTMVTPQERERIGLTPRTGRGVIHPNVYPTLDKRNKAVEALRDRLNRKRGKDLEAFQILFGVEMQGEGNVYVQIQLKHEPKGAPDSEENMAVIYDVQRRVLRSLTALEFHRPFLFRKAAAMTGYVTKEGLDKLAKNADVLGVCLDEAPLPDEPVKRVYDDLPPARPRDAASTRPGVAEMKVDPDVYRALDLTDRVDVMVSFREDSLPRLTDDRSKMWLQVQLRQQAVRRLQDKVLSTLSADEFWDGAHSSLTAGLSGLINREGLEKLRSDPDLVRINLNRRMRIEHGGRVVKP
jgi:hypothetical protein